MPKRIISMPKRIISELSPEQEAMLPSYRAKWRSLSILTEPINKEKIRVVIKAAYAVSGYCEPEILFYSSPMEAIKKVIAVENFKAYLGHNINIKFIKRVTDHLQHQIRQQLEEQFFVKLLNQIQIPEFPHYSTQSHPRVSYFPSYSVTSCLEKQLIADFDQSKLEFTDYSYFTNHLTRPVEGAIWGCMFDFCISVLKLQHDRQKWQVLQELMQHCGFIFQYEKVCIVCDRPCKLSFDQENRLHAKGEPAMQFTDGYSVCACHGSNPFELR
jgi:hypothetical protein